ncbi:MAG TPA: SBBP repeat-containing protein [Planctomycetota bacterium]|nr:SBBP repeat-containing protein [Planctomycetota bacterium]
MSLKTLTAAASAVVVFAGLAHREGGGAVRPSAATSDVVATAASVSADRPSAATRGASPLAFEANLGQVDGPSRYFTRAGAVTAYFDPDAFMVKAEHGDASDPDVIRTTALRLAFERSAGAEIAPGAALAGRKNYFHGDDPARWIVDVPTYDGVVYRGLYDGVDAVVRDGGGAVRYDLVVKPGADLSQVTVRVDGADRLELRDGELLAHTRYGVLRQTTPVTWQVRADGSRESVAANFRLIDDVRFGFDAPERDPEAELVVDPLLVYAAYVSGSNLDEAHGVATDAAGASFITGRTASTDYPKTPGCYDSVKSGAYEAYVTKMAPDGVTLVYSTYLGSGGSDLGAQIAVASDGKAIVTGWLGGSGFPTTAGAYDTSYNGFSDVFVTKLNQDGNGLVFSTFVGGANEDRPNGLALDPAGNVVVAGQTMSTNYPTVAGAADTTHNGGWDGFVFKLAAAGNALLMSSYLGGSLSDWAMSCSVAPDGAPVVVGATMSSTFPVTAGAFDGTPNGGFDAFVCRFAATGGALAWSTLVGGSGSDQAMGVDCDATGVYLAGVCGLGFPTTPGAFDVANDGGEAFVVKLALDGASLVYSTLLGGSSTDQANAIAVDPLGAAHVVGWTNSSNFPVSAITYDAVFNGGGSPADGFVVKLNASGSQLLFSSYLGSPQNDECRGVALDDASSTYVVGMTHGDMALPGPGYDLTPNGSDDAFVVKFDLSPAALAAPIGAGCNWNATPPALTCSPPVLGQTVVAVGGGAPANQPGMLLVGAAPTTNSFFGYGCVLQMSTVVMEPIGEMAAAGDGGWQLSALVAPIAENAGATCRVQGVFLSPVHPLGFVFTDCVEVTLGY